MTIHCAYDQLVRVADLKPHPKNPSTHSAAQVAAIAAVIEGNGWRAPITVSNRSGFITRGHGRLEAVTLLGCEQVPVDFQDYVARKPSLPTCSLTIISPNWPKSTRIASLVC